ncbi:PREDICTED: beta-1,3-galactosyltransferase 5 [Vollenhovia emeryi]|uniref:beta-1,3-galactosyltransferase 5 n=1 Tax=Vollenhovia emeryi TaxID=411798 RepID=UPI0005F41974|nr:PREDICTED: beta-1,3-galactosyltransferase 5 [Vollenhovia emeryi]XP_011867111.1 PREDICTED: beta-1,3-galactosyltransferase 5 [Vollenhovia emeryi]XP_011867112.1 PREDICTED: beta-1,3-galactosyltransferase 5 [Vollenhovia emeryi]
MLSKYRFFLLLACTGCVLLFVAFVERGLRPRAPKVNLIQLETVRGLSSGGSSGACRIVIEPPCNATFLIWLVTSYAGEPTARSALRRAYADEELRALGIRRVFLLGKLSGDAERKTRVAQNALLDESRRYNDILQGDFADTYRNLTRKHLMGLRWAVDTCRDVRYIVKMDDDIVVNVYGILEGLRSGKMEENSLTGCLLTNMVPIREPASKWYVSEAEYAGSVYPDFVSGWLYITRPRVASRLIDHAESSREYFWIDDVFVTGILRRALNIKIQDISDLFTTDHRYLECCIRGRASRLKCEFLVGPNGGDAELQVRFKEFAEFCQANCSVREESNLVGNTCVLAYEGPSLYKGAVQIHPVRIS